MPTERPRATGRLAPLDGEPAYVIEHAETLRPFLTTLASDSDLWLFASSTGALTAGRRSPAGALFPYVTEDKLHDAAGLAGPATALAVPGAPQPWHPGRESDRLVFGVTRRLWKSLLGHRLAFEEENATLGLRFRAEWRASHRFGLVRSCVLENTTARAARVRVLDGLVNVLPADVDEQLQLGSSVLVDAYRRSERLEGSRLAVHALAALVVDRPEPAEALRATVLWSEGLPGARVLLSAGALGAFDRGEPVEEEAEVRGERGAYLLDAEVRLAPGEAVRWRIVGDVSRTQGEVAALLAALRDPAAIAAELDRDLAAGEERLRRLVAATDGLQRTGDAAASAHHLANVLFNDLRGGLFAFGADVDGPGFAAFVARMSRPAAARHRELLGALPARLPRAELLGLAAARGDAALERLALEYLPLTFSRRHGDPSRPWNRFDIDVRAEDGSPRVAWQGNWRDIFQNWEALSLSHPGFLEHLVAKFVNASTADGHNPYRLSHEGVDWEVPSPGHPWAAIGYWGDHQLVYLARLLERSRQHHPGRLEGLLDRPLFTYADVPYRLAAYEELLADPRRTITFDAAAHARALARADREGADGKLLHEGGEVRHVTLAEKLLVPALAKLASLVPGGGVWMNTQRPEWNDANNALAGHGLSVVTACHLARYLGVVRALLAPLRGGEVRLSSAVRRWAEETVAALRAQAPLLEGGQPTPRERAAFLASVARPASAYRAEVYARGLGPDAPAPGALLAELAELGAAFARHTVELARRDDGLREAYRLLARVPGGLEVENLPVMLEGQVAALESGLLEPDEAVALLDALRQSPLWRDDQRSYLLYPDRPLPGFLEKNVIPEAALGRAPWLALHLAAGGGAVAARDVAGRARFAASITNAEACRAALEALRAGGEPHLDDAAIGSVLEVHELVFHHHAFTGRSGSMFAYEGLGCIYWHMVAKLLVAVQERLFAAAEAGAPAATLARLAAHHAEIRRGLGGLDKTPAEVGAFPLEPYSHTPARGGARQPGMTGQVKEEVITRAGELGVVVSEGRLAFRPLLLPQAEWLQAAAALDTFDARGRPLRIELERGTLGFTVCQVPVVYHRAAEPRVEVTLAGGELRTVPGERLDPETSAAIFERTGAVTRLDVFVRPGLP
jgi:hypothetical protein